MKKILIADDAEFNRDILKEIFSEQYEIFEAGDGEEAVRCIRENFESLSLIFLDLMMPKMSGLDVLEIMKDEGYLDLIPVIIITGEATVDTDAAAYDYGVADIIYKPFARRVITRRALNIIELYERRKKLELQLAETTSELLASRKKLAENNEFLVNALSSVVEFRSLESGIHINRVKEFTDVLLHTWAALHSDFDYKELDIRQMVNASALHDIGKISIPDEILLKPGRLTLEEFAIMKEHTTKGCEILEKFKQEDSDFYQYCYDICRYHHERYDGKGYPEGLDEDDIPEEARIIAVADAFDAMISVRRYRDAYPIDEVCEELERCKGTQFDPQYVNIMLDLIDEGKVQDILEIAE